MRPGQHKRSRGRNGGGGGPHGGGGGGGPHLNRPRPPHRSQNFESNGPSVKIRGNAYQVFERYLAMAREAQTSGDRVAAENLFQHAEHYFRVMNAQGEGQQGQPRPTTPADNEMAPEGESRGGEQAFPREGEQAVVQSTQPSSPPPASHEDFVRQLDEANHAAAERREDEQPPGFRSDF
jgi:Domain of unknown function (DUF4167)